MIDDQVQLYKKNTYPSGRVRYIPAEKIYDYDLIKPNTTYLVKCKPGVTSIRCIREEITPNYAPILSAIKDFEDEALHLLVEANKARDPKPRLLTPLEARAIKAYRDVMGNESALYFEGISMQSLVDKLIEFLELKIKEESEHPKS